MLVTTCYLDTNAMVVIYSTNTQKLRFTPYKSLMKIAFFLGVVVDPVNVIIRTD